MHIYFSTNVRQAPNLVWKGFDEKLFLALAPPFPPMKLLRFDGCNKGDSVHLQLWSFGWVSWNSHIIKHGKTSLGGFYFIDVGTVLPYFIRSWQHTHRIEPQGSGSAIIDDIRFTMPWYFLWMFPFVWLQFRMRKPVYRRIFG